ncbi:MAG: toxin-antitoxin system protein [Coprococcus sp.]|nr:toxin-antitoxin system protein [Coprococcus sp.]
MKFIYATYNQYCNSIDITTFDDILLRINCNKAEDGLKTTPNSQCALNALAIDESMEYARLVLDGEMQVWIDAEDKLEVW